MLLLSKSFRKICPVAMRADIRLWTAIAMIGICGFSVAQGWRIVHFSLAMVNTILGKAGRDHQHVDCRTGRCLDGPAS